MATRGRKRSVEARTPPGPTPDPPSSLGEDAREFWDRYANTINALGILEVLDGYAFSLLCESIATLDDMRTQFARDGEYTNVCGENGALQANPLVNMIAQQTKGILNLCAEFGMTPRGRVNLTGSLSCKPEDDGVDPMEALMHEMQSANGIANAVQKRTGRAHPAARKKAAKKVAKKPPRKTTKKPPTGK